METETERAGDAARAAAERLEAALERIAKAALRPQDAGAAPRPGDDLAAAEAGARLDTIIAELRAALAGKPDQAES
jgi:hypothetical protein